MARSCNWRAATRMNEARSLSHWIDAVDCQRAVTYRRVQNTVRIPYCVRGWPDLQQADHNQVVLDLSALLFQLSRTLQSNLQDTVNVRSNATALQKTSDRRGCRVASLPRYPSIPFDTPNSVCPVPAAKTKAPVPCPQGFSLLNLARGVLCSACALRTERPWTLQRLHHRHQTTIRRRTRPSSSSRYRCRQPRPRALNNRKRFHSSNNSNNSTSNNSNSSSSNSSSSSP